MPFWQKHTHTNNHNTLWSQCVAEQVPVSWQLLPFPCCNTIPMLLCMCLCVCRAPLYACIWFGFAVCVCLHGCESTYRWVVPSLCAYRCVISGVWAQQETHNAPMTDTPGWGERPLFLPYSSTPPVSYYHNRYRQEPQCYLHPSAAGYSKVQLL